jgi:hypothetical protein
VRASVVIVRTASSLVGSSHSTPPPFISGISVIRTIRETGPFDMRPDIRPASLSAHGIGEASRDHGVQAPVACITSQTW